MPMTDNKPMIPFDEQFEHDEMAAEIEEELYGAKL